MGTIIPVEVFVDQDFYVPTFEVLVEGKKDPEAMNDVISISYSDSLTNIDSFDMTINNWDAEALTFKYSDGDKFNPWKDVSVSMGYYRNGQSQRRLMLVGEITTMSPNFPGSGAPTLTVRGLNLFHRFRTKQETIPFFQEKDTNIAKRLVDKIAEEVKKKSPGLELQIDPEDVTLNLKNEQTIDYLVMNNQYPILFLMERARRIGYELTMREDTQGTKRVVTFNYRPTSNVNRKTYILEWGKSLISIQPTLQTANQVAEVTVRGWNPRTKAKIEVTVTRSELASKKVIDPTSDLAVTEPSLAQKLEIVADKPIENEAEARELATSTLRQIAQDIIVAKGKTVGLPDLRAGVKVQIKGLGKRFSGTESNQFQYLITETTHSISDSGYTTDFSARMEKP
jgi:uncharacterized protein